MVFLLVLGVGVGGLLPEEAGVGEQADCAGGDQVEVQARAGGDIPRQAGCRGVGLRRVLRAAAGGWSGDGSHRGGQGRGA